MEITYEQFLAGSLLFLNELDELDLSLLEEKLKSYNISVSNDREVNDPILSLLHSKADDSVSLSNNDILLSTRGFSLEESKYYYLSLKAGNYLTSQINKIDQFGFLIKKINSYVGIKETDIDSFFGTKEKELIKSALLSDQLYYSYEGDFIYDEERYLHISRKGHTTLFIYDNEKSVNEFYATLELNGYDSSILFDYLGTVDSLNDIDVSRILSIPSIEEFANDYDRCIYLPLDEVEGSISYYPQKVKKS